MAHARLKPQPKDGPTEEIALNLLDECPTNPRKTFHAIEELAASIRAVGLLQPLLVRRRGDRYEIVCGHRRARAARLAGLTTVPVRIREFATEADVLEAQVAENCARADIHPLEEAEAFAALAESGRSIEAIAANLGRNADHVAKRLKLRELSASARAAFLAGRVPLGVAYLLARIPNEEHQDAALEAVAAKGDREAMSVREASEYIQSRFMLRLAEAPFDRKDAKLVAAAGPCTTCPKRTGNQPSFFEDVKTSDTCIDPACYAAKVEANWQRAVARAEKQGIPVLPENESKKLWRVRPDRLDHWSAYVDPTQAHPSDPAHRSWKELLGKKSPKPVLARSPRGVPVRVISRAEAEVILEAGRDSGDAVPDRGEAAPVTPSSGVHLSREHAGKAAREVLRRLALRFREEGLYPEVWTHLMRLMLDGSVDSARAVDSSERRERIDEALAEPDVRELQAFLAEDLLAVTLETAYGFGERPKEIVELSRLYEIDYDAISRDIAEAESRASAA